ncbi:MAG: DUF1223 domain-containing protein, partial [Leptospiraceae bacterium]|nr:DUF1223 domain-containing protein [Leptospiraceae bacterium]
SFHVDYWDYIGWKDPYSKSKFSARQRSYSKKLKSSTYTPQIVINGKIDVIGSRKWEILGQVSKINEKNTFIHLPFSTKKKKNEIELKLSSLCKFDKDYIVQTFLVKKKTLDTVTRGENRGKKLQSSNVVIDWKTLNDTDKNFKVSFSIPSGKQNDYFIALYIQDSKNLDIVGVGVEK